MKSGSHGAAVQRGVILFFFFQAEDGIRDWSVTGVQTCALPISAVVRAVRGLALLCSLRLPRLWRRWVAAIRPQRGDRKSVVEGKSVDLGGRRIIKKKKKRKKRGAGLRRT